MNPIIPINQHQGKQAVSARDLHSFLESKQDFSNWIKSRIDKYGLIEGSDFVCSTKLLSGNNQRIAKGGANKIEYILAVDTAKELAMVEGNEKGRQARRYFIACAKKLQELEQQTRTTLRITSKRPIASRYIPYDLYELTQDFKALIYKDLIRVENTRLRLHMARTIEFYTAMIEDQRV